MRGFFRRLNHRDAVLRDLDALLLAYPRRRRFDRDFPALKTTIRNDYEAGVPPAVSALRISSGVIGKFVEQLGEGGKESVLHMLVEQGRAGFAEVAHRRTEGEPEVVKDRVAFWRSLSDLRSTLPGVWRRKGRSGGTTTRTS